jgi:hypothetical protein
MSEGTESTMPITTTATGTTGDEHHANPPIEVDDTNEMRSDAPSTTDIKSALENVVNGQPEIITDTQPFLRFGKFRTLYGKYLKSLFGCDDSYKYRPTNPTWQRRHDNAIEAFFAATVSASILGPITNELEPSEYYQCIAGQAKQAQRSMFRHFHSDFHEKWSVIPNTLPQISTYITNLDEHFQCAQYYYDTTTIRRSTTIAACEKVSRLAQGNYPDLTDLRENLYLAQAEDITILNPLITLRGIVEDIMSNEHTKPANKRQFSLSKRNNNNNNKWCSVHQTNTHADSECKAQGNSDGKTAMPKLPPRPEDYVPTDTCYLHADLEHKHTNEDCRMQKRYLADL